jgi:hypothetical protein
LATDCLEGRRNNSLARYLGHLLAHRHRPEEAFQIAWHWNLHCCKPPIAETEFVRTYDSIVARHIRVTEGR